MQHLTLCTCHISPNRSNLKSVEDIEDSDKQTYSVYVLTKGGLIAIGQVSLDDEMPQSAPNKDDGQVQQDKKLEVVGTALRSIDKGALSTDLICTSTSCSSCYGKAQCLIMPVTVA